MNLHDGDLPYDPKPRDDETGEDWKARMRRYSESEDRTLREVMDARPKMNFWERMACCCGCVFIIPVPLALFGLVFGL